MVKCTHPDHNDSMSCLDRMGWSLSRSEAISSTVACSDDCNCCTIHVPEPRGKVEIRRSTITTFTLSKEKVLHMIQSELGSEIPEGIITIEYTRNWAHPMKLKVVSSTSKDDPSG